MIERLKRKIIEGIRVLSGYGPPRGDEYLQFRISPAELVDLAYRSVPNFVHSVEHEKLFPSTRWVDPGPNLLERRGTVGNLVEVPLANTCVQRVGIPHHAESLYPYRDQ